MNVAPLFSSRRIVTTLMVVLAAALCVRLGFWQLDRLSKRRATNLHVLTMMALPALDLPSSVRLELQEYRTAQAIGTYDFSNQIALRNQVHEGQYGLHLLTPLRLQDAGGPAGLETAILVDRGWIPATGNERRKDWGKYDVAGTVMARGLVRLGQDGPPLGGMGLPTPAPGQESVAFWPYVDLHKVGEQIPYSIYPVYLQLETGHSAADLPAAAVPPPDLGEGPHLGYAVQWFGFSAILLVGYPIYAGKQEEGKA